MNKIKKTIIFMILMITVAAIVTAGTVITSSQITADSISSSKYEGKFSSCTARVEADGSGDYTDLKTALGAELSGTLCIGEGTYNFGGTINYYRPVNLTVIADPNAIIVLSGGTDDGMVRFDQATNFKWVGGQFTGDASYAFWIYRELNNAIFENIYCHDMTQIDNAGCVKIRLAGEYNVSNIAVINSRFENVTSAFYIKTKSNVGVPQYINDITFKNNYVDGADWGFFAGGENESHHINNIKVLGNTIKNIYNDDSSAAGAIHITALTDSDFISKNVVITNNYIENVYNTSGALSDHEGIYSKAENNIISNNILINAGYFAIGVRSGVNNSVISDNYIYFDDDYSSSHTLFGGIHAVSDYNTQISGNVVVGAKGTLSPSNRNACGISISGDSYSVGVTDNMIMNADYGICASTLNPNYPIGPVYMENNKIYDSVGQDYIGLSLMGTYNLIQSTPNVELYNNTAIVSDSNITAELMTATNTNFTTMTSTDLQSDTGTIGITTCGSTSCVMDRTSDTTFGFYRSADNFYWSIGRDNTDNAFHISYSTATPGLGVGDIAIFDRFGQLTVSGETNIGGISGDGTGKAVCIKSDGDLGTCSDAVGAGGTCTCA